MTGYGKHICGILITNVLLLLCFLKIGPSFWPDNHSHMIHYMNAKRTLRRRTHVQNKDASIFLENENRIKMAKESRNIYFHNIVPEDDKVLYGKVRLGESNPRQTVSFSRPTHLGHTTVRNGMHGPVSPNIVSNSVGTFSDLVEQIMVVSKQEREKPDVNASLHPAHNSMLNQFDKENDSAKTGTILYDYTVSQNISLNKLKDQIVQTSLPRSVSQALLLDITKSGYFLGNGSTLDFYPYPDEVDLRIIVLVHNRFKSLQTCLDSLVDADYMDDQVSLHVWIDRDANTDVIPMMTYVTAKRFIFPHGMYHVHIQPFHVGIQGQWMNTWRPGTDSKEIVVIFEDDMIVSPLFYM